MIVPSAAKLSTTDLSGDWEEEATGFGEGDTDDLKMGRRMRGVEGGGGAVEVGFAGSAGGAGAGAGAGGRYVRGMCPRKLRNNGASGAVVRIEGSGRGTLDATQ